MDPIARDGLREEHNADPGAMIKMLPIAPREKLLFAAHPTGYRKNAMFSG